MKTVDVTGNDLVFVCGKEVCVLLNEGKVIAEIHMKNGWWWGSLRDGNKYAEHIFAAMADKLTELNRKKRQKWSWL